MDDIVVIANTEDEAIERLEMVLNLAASYNLQIKWKKCKFLMKKIEILGHEIEDGNIKASESKTKDVNKYPVPKNKKELQRFLGFANYFRKFIDNFAFISKPLSDLMRNEARFQIGERERNAFESLKQIITQRPVLMIYRPEAETQVHTDASKFATAAILMQRSSDDNEFHPVMFMSNKTTEAQEKWFSYELEMYAVFSALTKWRNYLIDIKFTVITDCEALKTATDKSDVRKISAWLMVLQSYDFSIIHRSGTKMQHVDALSRINLIQNTSIIHQLKLAQEQDSHIATIIDIIKEKPLDDYVMHNGLLCKFTNSEYRIVVPELMETNIISKAHREGHFKRQKLEALISKEFFIQNLPIKIDSVVRNCIECILCNRKEGKMEGFLYPINKEPIPFDTFHLDHLGPMPSTNKNYAHILAIIDSFTKFVWLFPVKSTTANETINKLKIVTNVFGNPRRIIADRGTAFTSNIFKEFCREEDIQLNFCTTGVPRGNGQIERINRIIISTLSKLSIENAEKWFKHVEDVQRVINSTHQRTINTTPFELMFGVKMRKKDVDIQRMIDEEMKENFNEERDELRQQAKENILKIQEQNKRNFDRKRKEASKYEMNDLVAIKKTQFSTGAKLKPKNVGPYKITKIKSHDRFDVEKVGNHDGPNITSTSADHMTKWPTMNMVQQVQTPNRGFMVAIEGNIATGKSTLLNFLSKSKYIECFQEPVHEWENLNGYNLLAMKYEDPENYSFAFQSYAMLTMMNILNTETKNNKLKVMERSILSAQYCFVQALLDNNSLKEPFASILTQWFQFMESNFDSKPDLIIYLREDPEKLLLRIKKRGRKSEQEISINYLKQIHELHEKWIHKMKYKCNVWTIDSSTILSEDRLKDIRTSIEKAGECGI